MVSEWNGALFFSSPSTLLTALCSSMIHNFTRRFNAPMSLHQGLYTIRHLYSSVKHWLPFASDTSPMFGVPVPKAKMKRCVAFEIANIHVGPVSKGNLYHVFITVLACNAENSVSKFIPGIDWHPLL
jgi:hypothetical protein